MKFLGIKIRCGAIGKVLQPFYFHQCPEQSLRELFECIITGVSDSGDGFILPSMI